MKDGTTYGGRLRKVFAALRQTAGKPQIPELDEPLRRLAVAILGVDTSDEEAAEATDRILTSVVDWNEIRVSSAEHVYRVAGDGRSPGINRCQRLIEALQSIYDKENRLSLDGLKSIGRRDARQYLEKLEGVDEYAVASVVLWSLGGHAIPVNDRLLAALREADLVHPQADRAEIQAFIERHVSAADAREFCVVIQSLVSGKRGSGKRTKAEPSARRNKKERRAS